MLDLGAMFCKRMDERTTIVDLERRLAESETRYRLLIESWAQAEWETNADGGVVTDSPSWRAYTGQTVDEWLGYGWLDAIHPDDRAYAERQWREAIAAHRLVDAEFRLRSSSGGWRWTNVRAAPVLDAGGAIEKWAGINIDIDARKRAEVALRKSEELHRIAFSGGRMGTWRWNLRDKLIWGDAAFLELWGFRPSDEPRGLADFTDRMTPQGQTEMGEMVTRALAAGEEFDGQLAVVNGPTSGRWVRWRGRAEREQPWLVNGVSFDVTAQRLADERLRASEERYRAFVTASSDAVYRMSPDWLEMRQLDGRGFLSDTGSPDENWIETYILPEDRPHILAAIDASIRGRRMFELEHRVLRADGSVGWTLSRAVPIFAADGAIAEWLGSARDVTERMVAEAALRQSEARLAAAFESVPAGVGVVGTDGYVVIANEQLRRYLPTGAIPSRDPSMLPRWRAWNEQGTPLQPEEFPGARSLRGERVVPGQEMLFMQEDGREVWTQVASVPIYDAAGRITATSSVISDIDGVKRALQAQRESEARQAFLLKLSDALRPLRNARETRLEACRLLGEHLSASRAYYVEYQPEQGHGVVADDYLVPGLPSLAGRYPFEMFRSTYERIGDGRTWVVPDVTTNHELAEQERVFYAAQSVLAWVNVPLAKDGVLEAALCVVQTEPRDWTTLEITLVEETAERLWAAVYRGRSEIALRESEERFAQFGEASSDVLWIRDAETLQWSYLTPAFEMIYGLDRETALRNDNMAGWLDLIIPEDRQTALDSIQRVHRGERVAFEYRVRRPIDGQVRWLRNTDFPMLDAAGRVCWIGGIGRDITEEKAAIQRQEVLVNELQHRARNLLGVVTAVADRTLRQGGSVDAFEERLQALGRAQALLSQAGSDTVEVGAMVQAELAAHTQDGSKRVRVGGPEVQLTARQVQNFALALHELTTNAVKYGALKNGTGRLAVTWEIILDGRERRRLALSWVESDVPVDMGSVTRRGYGTELIQEALAYALQASVDYVLGPDGVRCRIEMPIS